MVLLCLGGVCIPIHLLLAFLVTLAHRHGFLLFLKSDWFVYTYWKRKIFGPKSNCSGDEKSKSDVQSNESRLKKHGTKKHES